MDFASKKASQVVMGNFFLSRRMKKYDGFIPYREYPYQKRLAYFFLQYCSIENLAFASPNSDAFCQSAQAAFLLPIS